MPTGFNWKRFGKGFLRASIAGGIVFTMGELTGIRYAGIPVAGAVAAVGKLLRDKIPALSWLPF